MLRGKSLVELAADLSIGAITTTAISDELGEGVLNSVLALAGGTVAAGLTAGALKLIDDETGIVSGLGSVVDDIFGIFD